MWNPQPPSQNRTVSLFHPSHRQSGTQIAWVRLYNKRVWIPALQPGDQAALPAKIIPGRWIQDVKILTRRKIGTAKGICDIDSLSRERFSRENAQALIAGIRQQVNKRSPVRGQDALLECKSSIKFIHGIATRYAFQSRFANDGTIGRSGFIW